MGLICLDLDGTLVENSLVEVNGKLGPAPGCFTEPVLRFPDSARDVLYNAAKEGDSFAIVTNQGGVAWGYATEEEVFARIGRAIALLDGFWGAPVSVHVCFAHERATVARYRDGHERRKPSGAMIQEAMDRHLVLAGSAAQIVHIGDMKDDEDAAAAAGIDFAWADDFFA